MTFPNALSIAGLDRNVLPNENVAGKNIFEETIDPATGIRDLRPITGEEKEDKAHLEELRHGRQAQDSRRQDHSLRRTYRRTV